MPAAIDTVKQLLGSFAHRAVLRAGGRRGVAEFTTAR